MLNHQKLLLVYFILLIGVSFSVDISLKEIAEGENIDITITSDERNKDRNNYIYEEGYKKSYSIGESTVARFNTQISNKILANKDTVFQIINLYIYKFGKGKCYLLIRHNGVIYKYNLKLGKNDRVKNIGPNPPKCSVFLNENDLIFLFSSPDSGYTFHYYEVSLPFNEKTITLHYKSIAHKEFISIAQNIAKTYTEKEIIKEIYKIDRNNPIIIYLVLFKGYRPLQNPEDNAVVKKYIQKFNDDYERPLRRISFYQLMAKYLFQMGLYKEAEKACELDLKNGNNTYYIYKIYGKVLMKLKKYDEAINVFKKCHELIENKNKINLGAIEIDSHLLYAYSQLGKKDKALEVFNFHKKNNPNLYNLCGIESAGLLMNTADEYLALNEEKKALKLYDTILGNSPFQTDAMNRYGKYYYREKKYKKAREYFEQAIDCHKYNFEANLYLGKICLATNDKEKAKAYFENALENALDEEEREIANKELKSFEKQ